MGPFLAVAWNGSWNDAPNNPSAAGAVSAITRAICAASAHGARGRTSCKRLANVELGATTIEADTEQSVTMAWLYCCRVKLPLTVDPRDRSRRASAGSTFRRWCGL